MGLREIVERCSLTASCDWLRIVPVLDFHKKLPRIELKEGKARKSYIKEFQAILPEIKALINDSFVRHKSEDILEGTRENKDVKPALAHDLDEDSEGNRSDEVPQEIVKAAAIAAPKAKFVMGHSWMRALVRYTPTLHCISDLFDDSIKTHAAIVLPVLERWLMTMPFTKQADFEALLSLFQRVDSFRNPGVVAAVVRNPSADNEKWHPDIFRLMASIDDENILNDQGEVRAELRKLEFATKEWFRRAHAEEKEEKEDNSSYSNYWNSPYYAYEKPVKKLSPQEIAKKRLSALRVALDKVSRIFDISFFDQHTGGILFELGRCHFFKGSPHKVLGAICALGLKDLTKYSRHATSFLSAKGIAIIREVVPGMALSKPEELLDLLAVMYSSLPLNSSLCHSFVHALVHSSMGGNDVCKAALSQSSLWMKVIKKHGNSETAWAKQEKEMGETSPTLGLLRDLSGELKRKASAIANSSCTLEALHEILPRATAFVSLTEVLGLKKILDQALLSNREKEVHDFDESLAELKCFVSFFCECGVPIDSAELSSKVRQVSETYNTTKLEDASTSIKGLVASHGSVAHWLFKLRSSTLFLNLWRKEGQNLATSLKVSNPQFRPLPPNQEPEEVEEKKAEEAPPVAKAFLTQDEVLRMLIPKVDRLWAELLSRIKSQSIAVTDLEVVFDGLDERDFVGEIQALADTGGRLTKKTRISSAAQDSDWIRGCLTKLFDFSFLLKMKSRLPGVLRIRSLMENLFQEAEQSDLFYNEIIQLVKEINEKWKSHTLASLSELVKSVKEINSILGLPQLEFLSLLSECEALVTWLLSHSSTAEFNRLLQVCRPCTDEPRLLSSIASLVALRTLLLKLLYIKPPYKGLRELLETVRTDVDLVGDEPFFNLRNIQSSFDGLLDVFEKQTRSPGIKACFDIRTISQKGQFLFRCGSDENKVLVLTYGTYSSELTDQKHADGQSSQNFIDESGRHEPLEFLLDLRSKIMMTEIPEELDKQENMTAYVEAFVAQLQVLCEMRAALVQLYSAGHFRFQEGYTSCYKFKLDGLPHLQDELANLEQERTRWESLVQASREQYYFLNYFTMRDLLRVLNILHQFSTPQAFQTEQKQEAEEEAKASEAPSVSVSSVWVCERCTLENPPSSSVCSVCEAPRPGGGPQPQKNKNPHAQQQIIPLSPVDELCTMLHLVHHAVDKAFVEKTLQNWVDERSKHQNDLKAEKNDQELFRALGTLLNHLFGYTPDGKPVSGSIKASVVRAIPPPSEKSENRSDMLISISDVSNRSKVSAKGHALGDNSSSLPVWVACTESPSHVIEVTLSIYVRRARLPDPGEVLFCTTSTSLEELSLVMYRFLAARRHGMSNCIFCIADVHFLSYSVQCSLVELIRSRINRFGFAEATSLVLISGKPKQVLLTQMSSQMVDLPSLDAATLRQACNVACSVHCGETHAFLSTINGGGKTHALKRFVGEQQKLGMNLKYRRVPFRESSSAASLVGSLSSFSSASVSVAGSSQLLVEHNAFHLDISHIIPPSANTLLFELLILGVVKDRTTSRVYYRRETDVFLLEIPNSVNDVTARALRFCSLLPSTHLEVTADSLDLKRPLFTNAEQTQISIPEYSEMIFVCKFLRAFEDQKFLPGNNFDPEYNPWIDDEITPSECFGILNRHVQVEDPSWATFYAFLSFMYAAFVGMNSYPVFNGHILAAMNGLEALKHVFTSLLIETSKDFSLRAVPRGTETNTFIWCYWCYVLTMSFVCFDRFSVCFSPSAFRG